MTTVSTLRINLDAESADFNKDLQKAERRLKSFSKNARSANDSNGGLGRSFRSASQSIAAFEGPLSGVSGRLSSMSSLMGSTTVAWGAFGAAVAAASYIMIKATAAFSEMEQQQLRTEALLKATGNTVGFTAGELDKMARSVALNTLASTQGVRDAQATLLTFKTVSRETFSQAIDLSQDMAAVFGSDIKSSALQLGKALEEPTQGLSALRRSGVSFTQSQKEMIKSLEDTGRVADAQKIILKQLQDQVGGAAAAEAGGLAGATDTLGQRWEEFLESLGKTTGSGSAAGSGLMAIANALAAIKEHIDPTSEQEINSLLEDRAELVEKLDAWYMVDGSAKSDYTKALIKEIDDRVSILKSKVAEEEQAKDEARKKAESARIAREKEQAAERRKVVEKEEAKKLEAQQNAGLRTLATLDNQFAGENERLRLANERRLQQIDQLQVSKEELERRGFENTEALKDEYRALSDEKYQADLEMIRLRAAEKARVEVEAEKKKQQELAASQKRWDATVTSMQMNLANESLSLIKSVSKEGSAVWVAATIAQKALAMTQAVINTEVAATGAMAAMPGPPGVAMAATVRSLGYASVGLIAAQGVMELAGAREKGGFVGTGRSYLVGEAGPEIFTPGASGQISSNDNLMNSLGAGQAKIQQITFAPTIVVEAGASQTEDAEFGEQAAQGGYNLVVEDLQTNGPISQLIKG